MRTILRLFWVLIQAALLPFPSLRSVFCLLLLPYLKSLQTVSHLLFLPENIFWIIVIEIHFHEKKQKTLYVLCQILCWDSASYREDKNFNWQKSMTTPEFQEPSFQYIIINSVHIFIHSTSLSCAFVLSLCLKIYSSCLVKWGSKVRMCVLALEINCPSYLHVLFQIYTAICSGVRKPIRRF